MSVAEEVLEWKSVALGNVFFVSNSKTFLVSTYVWQKDVAKTPKRQSSAENISGAGKTWFGSVTIYCTVFQ